MQLIEIIWIVGFAVFFLFWFWLDRCFTRMIVALEQVQRRLANLEHRFVPPAMRSPWPR